ncbi:MAG: DUF2332 domain-containing protein, partial [Novosphingobium sp.]|nr:DUF2332 domain-containing protein [Novosphingobium sp.]
MEIASMDEAIAWQADHADHSAAPCTARVVRAQRAVLATDTQVARRMTNWPGLLLADALPLRLAGGLHNLFLTGDAPKLGPVYAGELTEQAAIDALVARLVERFDARLSPWLDGPPQTNEAGRSAGIMAGLLWLAEKLGPRFEMNEIGASAGTNTMMDRFAFDLGGVKAGPETSPMRIAPEWRGPPPPSAPVEIAAIRGCDLNPVDLTNPAAALRLKSYVWAENLHRLERIDAAIALACEKAPLVDRADAGEWVVQRLVEPQASGVTRVLFHSIVWNRRLRALRACCSIRSS